jgi:predicted ATPase
MIIKKLNFQNFKSFGNDSTNQNLSNFEILTLIYGENNSGKSNLLKFINLLFKEKVEIGEAYFVGGQTLTTPQELSSFWKGKNIKDAFLFHKNDRSKDIVFEVVLGISVSDIGKLDNYKALVKDFEIDKNFDLELKGKIVSLSDPFESEIILESVYLNGKEVYFFEKGIPRYFYGLKESEFKDDSTTFQNFMGLLNNCTLFLDYNRFLGKEVESDETRNLTSENLKNWLHNKSLDQLNYVTYEKYLQFIKDNSFSGSNISVLKKFDPTFDRKDEEIDVFLKNASERLPINSYGTGIMQILLILSMIYDTNSKIILVEELELNLSPQSQQELLKILSELIKSGKIDQVIFTSHSNILAQTTGLSVYEVQMSNEGVSKINFQDKIPITFFERKKNYDADMNTLMRDYGVGSKQKPEEWE